MKRFAFLAPATFAVAASFATVAHAQWSTDPNANLVVADGTNEQVQPKMAATADGGFYVSWFDNSTGGYDVRLQRLDVAGNELWPHNGVLVADRDFSSTEDYGLSIDADGNALLAFRFNESGVAQALAQKVAPNGSLLWGDTGIVLSADSGDIHSPKISSTGGGIVVGWTSSEGSVTVQKLDSDGNPLWGTSGISIDPTTGIFFFADIHGDADGNAIVSWVPYIGSSHELWAQKLASVDGSNLWGTDPVEVFDGSDGALQFGNFPSFIEDGTGGAVFVWYTVTSQGSVRVQHVDASGTQLFPQNGVLASIDDSQNHFEPDGAYDPATGDIYALWRETDLLTQGQIGVYAQRIDSTGARLWGDGGKVIVPLSSFDQTEMVALPATGGGMIAAWSSDDYPNPTPLHAARIDPDGNYVWPGDIIDFSIEASDSGRLTGALSTQGYAAYAWTAGAATLEGDIHAQNINMDGTLGYVDTDTIFQSGFDPED
jgi:hypothetical protein